MASNIRALSASQLKELTHAKGGNCTIVYVDPTSGTSYVVMESYPKAVGIAFSKVFADQFPPVNKIKLADIAKPKSNSVMVTGGRVEDHKLILTWMLSCCEGKGIRDFATFPTKKFTRYYLIREAATVLGVQYLVDLMNKRMSAIASVQVHSEDIRALYLLLGADNELVKEITLQTAALMAKGPSAIKAYNVYATLAQELPPFGSVVIPIVGEARIRQQEHHNKHPTGPSPAQRRAWAEQKKQAYAARKEKAAKTQAQKEASSTEDPATTKRNTTTTITAKIKTKTIRAELRGHRRILLPLSQLELNETQFLAPIDLDPHPKRPQIQKRVIADGKNGGPKTLGMESLGMRLGSSEAEVKVKGSKKGADSAYGSEEKKG